MHHVPMIYQEILINPKHSCPCNKAIHMLLMQGIGILNTCTLVRGHYILTADQFIGLTDWLGP